MKLDSIVKSEVSRLFTGRNRKAVLNALERSPFEEESIRLPLALLFACRGNPSLFFELLESAKKDWRDVLLKTNLADDYWEQTLIGHGFLSHYFGRNWITFSPDFLINIAKDNLSQEPDLEIALAGLPLSKRAQYESLAYIRFVPEKDWDFDRSIAFVDHKLGSIVFDMMKDGRVGGVEFGDNIT